MEWIQKAHSLGWDLAILYFGCFTAYSVLLGFLLAWSTKRWPERSPVGRFAVFFSVATAASWSLWSLPWLKNLMHALPDVIAIVPMVGAFVGFLGVPVAIVLSLKHERDKRPAIAALAIFIAGGGYMLPVFCGFLFIEIFWPLMILGKAWADILGTVWSVIAIAAITSATCFFFLSRHRSAGRGFN